MREYLLPACMAVPISRHLATLHEFQTVYSVRDALDMWELVRVDDYNAYLWSKVERR